MSLLISRSFEPITTIKPLIVLVQIIQVYQSLCKYFRAFLFPVTVTPVVLPILFPCGSTALVGQSLLTVEASRSHSLRCTTLSRTPLDE